MLLPYQTRYFNQSFLDGRAWEQGSTSFYISWIPLISVVILGFFNSKQTVPLKIRKYLFLLVASLGVINIIAFPYAVIASAMWWIQVLILLLFFITLYKNKIEFTKVLFWFAIALIPTAIFAILQAWIQFVPGSSWLGVASQSPIDLGTSVVQSGSMRWLRAYGMLPHPNIMGGYMVFGIIISAWLYSLTNKKIKILILALIPVFSLALFYSFSRSAWIAVVIGLVILSVANFFDGQKSKIFASLVVALTFLLLMVTHWDLASTRIGVNPEPARLELLSNQSRSDSLKDGIRVFQANPLFGTGPNAELPALMKLKEAKNITSNWIEPPHNVWILFLANFGIMGALMILGMAIHALSTSKVTLDKHFLTANILPIAILCAWFVLTLFDHYPYSLWSGQVLSIFALSSLILKSNKTLD